MDPWLRRSQKSSHPRRLRAITLVVSVAVAASTVGAVSVPVTATAATGHKKAKVTPPRTLPPEHSVAGTHVTGAAASRPPEVAPAVPGPVAWPAAAIADLDLGAVPSAQSHDALAGSGSAGTGAGAVAAAGIPLSVAPVASVPSRLMRSAPGDTDQNLFTSPSPSKVRVGVADHATAVKAGVPGVIVSVARADGAAAASPVTVGLDYSGFSGAFGGDFADRLRLVSLPECVLTTPDLPACQKTTPVAATNDRNGKKLTAAVVVPGSSASTSSSTSTSATSSALATTAPRLVLATTTAPSGSTGTYTATSLKSSDTWSVGNNGSFADSEPVVVPPSLGGTAPSVALNYDSGSVDGRTTAENGQASWAGDGWDYNPGFIERSYKLCAKIDSTDWASVGDNCVTTPNATISLPGHSGELVRDDAAGLWRIAGDDGSRVELLSGAANGADNPKASGEYWRVTTSDGTRYYFGSNRLPSDEGGDGSTDAPTYSAWTEPVFGTGESTCNDPKTASPAACMAAWRWNLDFVVDPHHNVTRYDYLREGNWYKNPVTGNRAFYTRNGFLTSIDYGFQAIDVITNSKPAAQVLFGAKPRCIAAGLNVTYANMCNGLSVTQDPNHPGFALSGIAAANAPAFLDVPFDQNCVDSSSCTNYAPSFWSSVRLDTITTAVAYPSGTSPQIVAGTGVSAGYLPVDKYTLHESMPSDTTVPTLWLDGISRVGYTGAVTTAQPDIQFTGTPMPNRAPAAGANAVSYSRRRLTQINDEMGGATSIEYDYNPQNTGLRQYPCTSTAPVIDKNSTLCFPVYWVPPTGTTGATPSVDWFSKYVVLRVMRTDMTDLAGRNGSATATFTNYAYPDAPVWHSNDSELADPKYRTFDQFHGFQHIVTIAGGQLDGTGSLTNANNSKTVTTYMQGMNQDPDLACQALLAQSKSCAATDNPVVNVADSAGTAHLDDVALTGAVLEKQTFDSAAPSAKVNTDVISNPVLSAPTAQHVRSGGLPVSRARFQHTGSKVTVQEVAAGTRRSEIDYSYDDRLPDFTGSGVSRGNGRLVAAYDLGDGTVPKICTNTQYAANGTSAATAEWTAHPSVVTTSVQPTANCSGLDGPPAPLPDQIGQGVTQTFYDDAALGRIGSDANVTMVKAESDATGHLVVKSQTPGSDFDEYGRAKSSADALGRKTTTVYFPAYGVLPTSLTVTNPAGWPAVTTLDQTRGLQLTSSDVNGLNTTAAYDGLGRLSKVWKPGRATTSSPTQQYTYSVAPVVNGVLKPSSVETDTLREDQSYSVSIQIIDGLGRVQQTQATPPSDDPGTVVTDSVYDFVGRVRLSTGSHWDSANSPSGSWLQYDYTKLDAVTTTVFDALDRPLSTTLSKGGANLWTTTTNYYGVDRTDVLPPAGGTATSTITDVRGKTVQSWQYHENPPASPGAATDADVTEYTYTPTAHGATATVADQAGNTWTSTTDLLSRTVKTSDPNSGNTTSQYDDAGQLTTTQDGRGQNLAYSYDALGRKTAVYTGTDTSSAADPNMLTSFAYDRSQFQDPSGNVGAAVLGQATSSTRYVGGKNGTAYTQSTPYYDMDYKPRSTQVTIPSTGPDAGLSGTYTVNNHYTPVTDLLQYTELPAVPRAGLASESLVYGYNTNGQLLTAGGNTDYLTETVYSPLGEVVSRSEGDDPFGVTQQSLYDATTRRLTKSFVDSTAGVNTATDVLNTYGVNWTTYTYSPAGQITSASTQQGLGSPPALDTQCYTYDFAGQLKQAWTDEGGTTPATTQLIDDSTHPGSGPKPGGVGGCANSAPTIGNITGSGGTHPSPAPYWQTFTGNTPKTATDSMGNRVTATDHSVTGGADATHTYTPSVAPGNRNTGTAATDSGTGGPALLGKVVSTGGATDTYGYDGAGNTTSRHINSSGTATNQRLDWDAEGHLAKVTNTTTNTQISAYLYDAGGSELIRRDPTGSTLFLGETEIHLGTAGTNNGKTTAQRYYSFPNAPTIVIGSDGSQTFEAADPQDTGDVTIQETPGAVNQGLIIARRYTKPYGETRGSAPSSWIDDHGFLGKSTDTSTGLVDVGARKYDAGTGRFVSVDPVFQAGNPQAIDGYAYAGNDPVSASDPTGLDPGGMNCVDENGMPAACNASGAPGTTNTTDYNGSGSQSGDVTPDQLQNIFQQAISGVQCPAMVNTCKRLTNDKSASTYDPYMGKTIQGTFHDQMTKNKLETDSGLACFMGYVVACSFLNIWLTGEASEVKLPADSLKSYAAATDDQFGVAAKQIAMEHSTGTTWLTDWQSTQKIVGSDGHNPTYNMSPLAMKSNAESKEDWFLALNRVDYRIGVTIIDAHTVKYQFQILKYYSFDAPFSSPLGSISKDDLQRLNASGKAGNYYITGVSDPITVNYR